MKRSIILIVLLLLSSTTYGAKECMSFAHDPYADDNDYHTLHYVECYCPCRQYKQLPRGQCSYCGHYRYLNSWEIKPVKMIPQSQKTPVNVVDPKMYKLFGKYTAFNPESER